MPARGWLLFLQRIISVWRRHARVYSKNLLANGFPPVFEPLIFLGGVGLGLGRFLPEMDSLPYLVFLASGLTISTAMMTSAFECSYGTFVRLEFEHIYDGILAAPVSIAHLFLGEILWAGTKGFIFSATVLLVVFVTGIITQPLFFLAPLLGFLTGLMFGAFSLFMVSYIKLIDQVSFYFTGLISPMFFFQALFFRSAPCPWP